MKNLFNLKNTAALVAVLVAMMGFVAMDKAPAYDPVGTWNYEIETPDGAISGDMTIKKDGEGYGISVETDDFGTLALKEVKFAFEGEKADMTAEVDVQGVTAEFEVEFEGETMSGVIYYGGEELSIEAEREKK